MKKFIARMEKNSNRLILISLPIVLFLFILFNILYTEKVCLVRCSIFRWVPSNSAVDLIQTNHQSYGIYLVFAQLYKGKTIITPPDYWEKNFIINPELFTSWGELNAVVYSKYNPELSVQKFNKLSKYPNIQMFLYNNIDGLVEFSFYLIRNDEKTIAVFLKDRNVLIIPVDIVKQVIPNWEP